MAGFVSFVSSGPGDPELLTLKAVNRLKKADAILFDDLSFFIISLKELSLTVIPDFSISRAITFLPINSDNFS